MSNYKNATITLQTRSKFSHNVVYELDIRKYLLGSNEKIDGEIITMRTDLLKTDITKAPLVDFFPWIPLMMILNQTMTICFFPIEI